MDPSPFPSFSPNTYAKKTLLDIWQEFPLLLGAGILASLAWFISLIIGLFFNQPVLAVITLPIFFFPSLTGVFKLTGLIARGYNCSLRDFCQTFFKHYGSSFVLGLFVVVPYMLALGTRAILDANPKQIWFWISLTIQGAVFLIALLTCVHALSMISVFNLSLGKSIQYAWSLTAHQPIASVGILALLFLLMLPVIWTRFGLLPVVLGGWAMFATNLTLLIIRQVKFEQKSPASPQEKYDHN